MIAPLRRRHRRFLVAVAVAVPVLSALALSARPPVPQGEPLQSPPGPGGEVRVELQEPFTGAEALRLRSGGVLELVLGAPLRSPDVLAYWTDADSDGATVENAWLLGPVTASRPNLWTLPVEGADGGGALLLYSLAHQEEVLALDLPRAAQTPGGAP
ncbi:MAG: hypothetical protein AAGN66_23270 [Acidobacteriota bacterium]